MRLSNARSFFINNHVLACRAHVIMTGASFWYFLREKVLRNPFGGKGDRIWFFGHGARPQVFLLSPQKSPLRLKAIIRRIPVKPE